MKKIEVILLKTILYKESSIIIQALTACNGIQSFMWKGVKKKKNKQALFPLQKVMITYYPNANSELYLVKELQSLSVSMGEHPFEYCIKMFAAELLQKSLKNQNKNETLYNFIDLFTTHLSDFNLSNCPILFAKELTKYLGFFPNIESTDFYFNLETGTLTNSFSNKLCLNQKESLLFKKWMCADFQTKIQTNQIEKREVMVHLLNYYEFQIPNFRKPKSIQVLNDMFANL